jgi:hypothetical protein
MLHTLNMIAELRVYLKLIASPTINAIIFAEPINK